MSSGDRRRGGGGGIRIGGVRTRMGRGISWAGFIGMGQGRAPKAACTSFFKVQAALEMTEAYSSSITVSKTV